MLRYCGVCNAPVYDWDEHDDYGQCQEGHLVRSAYCTETPDKKLQRRIQRKAARARKKSKTTKVVNI